MKSSKSLLLVLALAIAGGLATAAAFPPAGFWPLAAAGPALLVVALWRRSLRGSAVVGLGALGSEQARQRVRLSASGGLR